MPIHRLLADLVVMVHAAYVLWVVLGLVAILVGYLRRWEWTRGFWFRLTHLLMLVAVVLESWFGIVCPLTTWEQWLRAQSGDSSYRGGFVAHLVHDCLFVDAPSWVFTFLYTLFGAVVLATFWMWPPRRRRPPCDGTDEGMRER